MSGGGREVPAENLLSAMPAKKRSKFVDDAAQEDGAPMDDWDFEKNLEAEEHDQTQFRHQFGFQLDGFCVSDGGADDLADDEQSDKKDARAGAKRKVVSSSSPARGAPRGRGKGGARSATSRGSRGAHHELVTGPPGGARVGAGRPPQMDMTAAQIAEQGENRKAATADALERARAARLNLLAKREESAAAKEVERARVAAAKLKLKYDKQIADLKEKEDKKKQAAEEARVAKIHTLHTIGFELEGTGKGHLSDAAWSEFEKLMTAEAADGKIVRQWVTGREEGDQEKHIHGQVCEVKSLLFPRDLTLCRELLRSGAWTLRILQRG